MTEKKRPMVSADVEYLTDNFYKELETGIDCYRDIIYWKFNDFKKGYYDEEEFFEEFDYSLIHSSNWEYPYDYVNWTGELRRYVEDMIADTVKDVIMSYIDTKYLEKVSVDVNFDCGDYSFEVYVHCIDFDYIRENNLWKDNK